MASNRKIGYTTIITAEREIPLFYTNRAIANAERLMEKGILGVLSGFQAGGSGVFEVAVLLQAGMEGARVADKLSGPRVTLNMAYRVLDEVGFTGVASKVFEAVGAVISKDADAIEADFIDDENEKK